MLGATVADAAQIYRCKTYQGGFYWSSDWCNKSGGITVDAVTVPSGMTFHEQARFGDQFVSGKQTSTAQEDRSRDTASTCRAIDNELDQIWSRYKDGNFVPAEQVGPDQTRTQELKTRRGQLGCQSR